VDLTRQEPARDVVESGHYAGDVRDCTAYYRGMGVRSVLPVIVDERHLLEGRQAPGVFEQVLHKIASRVALRHT
jgi:predicted DsbA family dithiol-disulfide isomerase